MNSTRYANMMSNHPDMVQAVPAMPMDNAAWSGSNSLGNIVDFAPDDNNRQIILKLDEWGPPDMWTISLAIDRTIPNMIWGGSATFEIVALIDFGVGGSTQRIEADWIDGTMLTVPMNALSVTAVYENPWPYFSGLRLGAQIARGTRAGSYAPTKQLHINAFYLTPEPYPNSQWQTFRLPPFTREIEILWGDAYTNPFASVTSGFIEFGDVPSLVDSLGSISGRIDFRACTAHGQRFRVPNGSRFIMVYENPNLSDPYQMRAFSILCHLQA